MNGNWTCVFIKIQSMLVRYQEETDGFLSSVTINSPHPHTHPHHPYPVLVTAQRILPSAAGAMHLGWHSTWNKPAFWYHSDLYTHYHSDWTIRYVVIMYRAAHQVVEKYRSNYCERCRFLRYRVVAGLHTYVNANESTKRLVYLKSVSDSASWPNCWSKWINYSTAIIRLSTLQASTADFDCHNGPIDNEPITMKFDLWVIIGPVIIMNRQLTRFWRPIWSSESDGLKTLTLNRSIRVLDSSFYRLWLPIQVDQSQ